MAAQDQVVRYISRRGENFDYCIRAQVDQAGYGVEWD
jgi:hypothetical protein